MSARFVFGSSMSYLTVTIATAATSLLLISIMTRALSRADYGVMLLIANGSSIINLLFGFTLAHALPTLFSSAATAERRRSLYTTILISVAAALVIPYATIIVFSEEISSFFVGTVDYGVAVALGALWSFLNACTLCLALVARMNERHVLYMAVQLPALVLQTVLIVYLLKFVSLGLAGFYIATAIAAVFAMVLYSFALRRWITGSFDSEQLASAARVGTQMLPWQFATILLGNSAAFFLTRGGHLDQAGLFSIAVGAAGLLSAISNSIESVWTPFVLKRKDQVDLVPMQLRIFSLFSSGLLIAASLVSLFAHEIFLVLVGPAFLEGYRLVPALSLVFCIAAFANCFSQGLQARLRTIHYSWIGLVITVVFLVTTLGMVGDFGAFGVVAGMGAGFLSMLILLQLMSGRFMPVPYPWMRHGLMWLCAIALVASTYQLDANLKGLAVKFASIVAISSFPFWFGALHLSDIRLIRSSVFSAVRNLAR